MIMAMLALRFVLLFSCSSSLVLRLLYNFCYCFLFFRLFVCVIFGLILLLLSSSSSSRLLSSSSSSSSSIVLLPFFYFAFSL